MAAHYSNQSFVLVSKGTEVKAITYSAMQIHDKEKAEIFVIVDV